MTHNPPERKPLIQNSVMKVRSGREPSKCPLLPTCPMFKETAQTGGLHPDQLSIMNEPHSPQRTRNGLVMGANTIEGSQEIIYIY